jgi:hypothetical protein
MRNFSAPGAPYAQDGPPRYLMVTGDNPIIQYVDPNAMTITNVAQAGHFFGGTVQLSIVQSGPAVYENIQGNGPGIHSTINQCFGPTTFFGLGMATYFYLNPQVGTTM